MQMALNDAALVLAANAVDAVIAYMQLHSTNVGGSWGTNAVGSRVAVNGTVDADGDITWTSVAFTGLTANQAVGGVSYWSASSGGTNYGGSAVTGDATANSAGEYTLTSVAENLTAA
jgi:hypothetical protein